MGYYTEFKIELSGDITEDDFNNELEEYGYGFYDECMSAKWYSWEDNMKDISTKYPEVLFILSGQGEENEDMWKAYFKNGKSQIEKAVITYGKFDEGKLK